VATRAFLLLLLSMLVVHPGVAQKKPDPKKPESAPVPVPEAPPLAPALQRELDSIGKDVGATLNGISGKTFDVAGTINTSQLSLLMEVADKAYGIFEQLTAGSGGVAGERATGSAGAGKPPHELLFGGQRCLILIFANGKEYMAFGKWYDKKYEWPVSANMKGVAYSPIAYPRCVIVSHLRPLDIAGMRNVVAHEVGHMVANRYAFNHNFSPVWFVEGLAVCIEGRALGTNSCYCFSGGYGDTGDQNKNLVNREWPKWKAQVKAQAKASQDKALNHIVPMQLTDMTLAETGKAMAMVDFWMQEPAKLIRWLSLTKKYWPEKIQYEWDAKKGEAQKRALKEAWGMEWQEMDNAWRTWVLANY
jgi:hypothetical protein